MRATKRSTSSAALAAALILALSIVSPLVPVALATNEQKGDNSSTAVQQGSSSSGDAVGGQVGGVVVSEGDANVDAKNRTEDADVETGPANGTNSSSSVVGQSQTPGSTPVPDECVAPQGSTANCDRSLDDPDLSNFQDGDNELDVQQISEASSGDAVAGQVIGAVVSGGTTDIVADNRSEDTNIVTGDATATNDTSAFVGLAMSYSRDASNFCGNASSATFAGNSASCSIDAGTDTLANDQEGDNSAGVTTSAAAASGDGVGGQVIGVVAAGDTSVDATNRTEDADIATGDADASNTTTPVVGLVDGANTDISNFCGNAGFAVAEDNATSCSITADGDTVTNTQDGDNDVAEVQAADASSGDSVGGQVIGAVTAASGSADITADNRSEDVNLESGDGTVTNVDTPQAGLDASSQKDLSNSCGNAVLGALEGTSAACTVDNNGGEVTNDQEGDNSVSSNLSGDASSGDAVGGQVLGAVSAGDTAIDAKNRSEDIDITTGAARALNTTSEASALLAGGTSEADNSCGNATFLASTTGGAVACTANAPGDTVSNTQDGNNDATVSADTHATSGDGVGGQVVGAVTSAGGSADITADNASEDVDIETGAGIASNVGSVLSGLAASDADGAENSCLESFFFATMTSPAAACTANGGADTVSNDQEGDNSVDLSASATAGSGDGVGGQVIGAVSAGDTTIDAKNRSEDVEVVTGGGDALNVAAGTAADEIDASHTATNDCGNTGAFSESSGTAAACTASSPADNTTNSQDGDNESSVAATVDASSGDGVGGQVIGAVTAASGSADITADNRSEDVHATTGEADATNFAFGQGELSLTLDQDAANGCATATGTAFSTNTAASCTASGAADTVSNDQHGDNESVLTASATASSGDAVGGEVIGAVSAGDTTIDAKNRSEDVEVESGGAAGVNLPVADASQVADEFAVTDNDCGNTSFGTSSPTAVSCTASSPADRLTNTQDGDNEASVTATAGASSGDAVGGQVVGSVTSAGGSADIAADNGSEDVQVSSGAADASNGDFLDPASAVAGPSVAAAQDTTNSCANTSSGTAVNSTASCSATGGADTFSNDQDGDNTAQTTTTANASSGDGVGGQVIGVVSAGDTSVDATNRSEDVEITSGDADATNVNVAFAFDAVGDTSDTSNDCGNNSESTSTNTAAACTASSPADRATNTHDGDNDVTVSGSADASSGDGVGGQVIGAVTAASGSADIVADNRSEDVEVTTGGAGAVNSGTASAGLIATDSGSATNLCGDTFSGTSSSTAVACTATAGGDVLTNDQPDDDSVLLDEASTATSGDGVGGQVIGVVSAGDTKVDATNRSEDVSIETGGSDATDSGSFVAGQEATNEQSAANECGNTDGGSSESNGTACTVTASGGTADNSQDGENDVTASQTSDATSGDGVGGQVLGVVTSASGSADVTADNRSENVEIVTGTASGAAVTSAFAGLTLAIGAGASNDCGNTTNTSTTGKATTCAFTADGGDAANSQPDGDNSADLGQATTASSGDGVGGQVAGIVSAGDVNVDLKNRSEDVSVETGNADAAANIDVTTGLSADTSISGGNTCGNGPTGAVCTPAPATPADLSNVQDGGNDILFDQASDATSGDGVGGQVLGIVASAGGTVDGASDNASTNADILSGESNHSEDLTTFVGLVSTLGSLEIGL